ncbi:MAG: hypothetical protein E7290_07505 [Lachnospiraceae bacterium]|nr:hypothetical protein [Lachnospiraceae bacterium]
MREKFRFEQTISRVEYKESILHSFHRSNAIESSFRVYKDGKVGIHYQVGEMSDEEGYALAVENLKERPRPYPFELETGKRSRDKTEREVTDKELMDIAKECMNYLCDKYPRFRYSARFEQEKSVHMRTNEKGMEYANTDCAISISVGYKHMDSKDILDGSFNFSLRDFDIDVFTKMADNYLANYEKAVELPEEVIIDTQYYGLLGALDSHLNGENIALKTSLLTDKIGKQVFSEEFTLLHDVSDEECWFNCFWDGDGCVIERDKQVFIDKGVVLSGYADKKSAKKYNIPHTKNAYRTFSDIPGAGGLNLRIARSNKTVKELLDGRYCVIPVICGGGGFEDNGDYTMPVQSAFLSDGEKILGKLPPFTIVSSMFDMFGKDFIGVGADNPIYNDKQILFRVRKSDIL